MLPVDNTQLQQGYLPIAFGIMVSAIALMLGTVATLLWLILRRR